MKAPSLLTITLNPAIDKTYRTPRLVSGKIHPIREVDTAPGGKGLNVARVAQQLEPGLAIATTGFVGGLNGQYIVNGLQAFGLKPDFVETGRESRLCVAIVETELGVDTKVNEVGPTLTDADADHLLEKLDSLAQPGQLAALCGTLPPGIRVSFYRECITLLQRAGVLCFLDTHGAPLAEGLKATPAYCKINDEEFSALAGGSPHEPKALAAAAAPWVAEGMQVIITLGARGAVWANAPSLFCPPPPVQLISAVGAGDAFLAGLMVSQVRGLPREEALKLALACGSASTEQLGAGVVDPHRVGRLALQAQVAPV